jgi:hypothetical protein
MRLLPTWEKKALERRLTRLPQTVRSEAFPTLAECRKKFGDKPPQRSVLGEKLRVDKKGHRLFWGIERIEGARAPVFLCIFHVSSKAEKVVKAAGRELYAVIAVSGNSHRSARDVYVLCAGGYEDFYNRLTVDTLRIFIDKALDSIRRARQKQRKS